MRLYQVSGLPGAMRVLLFFYVLPTLSFSKEEQTPRPAARCPSRCAQQPGRPRAGRAGGNRLIQLLREAPLRARGSSSCSRT